MAGDKKATRSMKEIEAELAANRDRLARTVDELVFRVSPAEVKRRQVVALKGKVNEAAFTPDGDVRFDRLAVVLGGVAGLAILLGAARRAFYRG